MIVKAAALSIMIAANLPSYSGFRIRVTCTFGGGTGSEPVPPNQEAAHTCQLLYSQNFTDADKESLRQCRLRVGDAIFRPRTLNQSL
jgi:hypothetical protein